MNPIENFVKLSSIYTSEDREHFLSDLQSVDPDQAALLRRMMRCSDQCDDFMERPAIEAVFRLPNESTAIDFGNRQTDLTEPGELDQTIQRLFKKSSNPEAIGRMGHYEVYRVIDSGGAGIVLKARDPKLSKWVAIKVMSIEESLDPIAHQRFMREARSIGQLDHKNVVRVDRVEEFPVPFLVMEYVEGQSLAQLLKKNVPISIDAIFSIATQVASGLEAIHERNLIHRDIKPGNILLGTQTPHHVKITDFGLARHVADRGVTRVGKIAGTPSYMSPEQVNDLELDARSDLFSLGIVLYEMYCSRRPFEGPSDYAVMNAICSSAPSSFPRTSSPRVIALQKIISKLLAKVPDERFQSATEVKRDLEKASHLHDQPEPLIALWFNVLSWMRIQKSTIAAPAILLGFIAAAVSFKSLYRVVPPTEIQSGKVLPLIKHDLTTGKPDLTANPSHSWIRSLRPPFTSDIAREFQLRWAKHLEVEPEFVNTVGIEMVLIPPGEYMIGYTPEESEEALMQAIGNQAVTQVLRSASIPTWVRIDFPFYMSKYELSEVERFEILGTDHSLPSVTDLEGAIVRRQRMRSNDYPVTRVPWDEGLLICHKLNQIEGLTYASEQNVISRDQLSSGLYRLPTDAEWEWAARAGRVGLWSPSHNSYSAEVWFLGNSGSQVQKRGQKYPNPFGLHDMVGNVQEWCLDDFDPTYFNGNTDSDSIMINPLMTKQVAANKQRHIVRGGSVIFNPDFCNLAFRTYRDHLSTSWFTGMRIVKPIPLSK